MTVEFNHSRYPVFTLRPASFETRILKPRKIPILLANIMLIGVCALLEPILYWVIASQKTLGLEVLFICGTMGLILPITLFYNLICILPKEGWLTLTAEGFDLHSCLKSRSHRYSWDEVQNFNLTYQANRYFRQEKISFWMDGLGIQRQKDFWPYQYAITNTELVQVLNDWKKQYSTKANEVVMEKTVSDWVIDKKIEKITERWGCGLAVPALALLIGFIVLADKTGTTTLKFSNFYKAQAPALTLTVKKQRSQVLNGYQLPPFAYQHQLELRIPSLERHYPIQIEYKMKNQNHCVRLSKHYGNWGQMDAIWITADGSLDAYAADYCQPTGRYSCRHIPDWVEFYPCDFGIRAGQPIHSPSQSNEIYMNIKPLTRADYQRLEQKKAGS